MAVQKQLLKGVLAGALALMLSGCVTIPDAIKGSSPMPQQDLVRVMNADAPCPLTELRVDGGASVSSFLMQFQADMLRVPIDRPKLVETTAFGAAFLAGIASGVWESVDDIALLRQSDRIFKPEMDAEQAKQYHDNWLRAVGRAEKWSQE